MDRNGIRAYWNWLGNAKFVSRLFVQYFFEQAIGPDRMRLARRTRASIDRFDAHA